MNATLAEFYRDLFSDVPEQELLRMSVTTFKACFDESGIHKPGVCVIAGFIGGPNPLDLLGDAWGKVLLRPEFSVPKPFHCHEFYAPAAEIMASKKNPYRGWDQNKRDEFINALMGVLEEYNALLIATGVDSRAFHQCTLDERRYLTGGSFNQIRGKWDTPGKPSSPYCLALLSVIECSAYRTPEDGKVAFLMSEQTDYEHGAQRLYRRILDRVPPHSFRHKL